MTIDRLNSNQPITNTDLGGVDKTPTKSKGPAQLTQSYVQSLPTKVGNDESDFSIEASFKNAGFELPEGFLET